LLAIDAVELRQPDLPIQPLDARTSTAGLVLTPEWLHAQAKHKGAFLTSLRLEGVDSATVAAIPVGQRLLLDGDFSVIVSDVYPARADDSLETSVNEDPTASSIERQTHVAGSRHATKDDKRYELTPEERDAVIAAASRRRTSIPLVILDLNWPDRSRAEEGLMWMTELLDSLRARHGLSRLPRRTLPADLGLPKDPHALAISESIAPIALRDTGRAVAVRYVPMIAGPGADSVLTDLVATYFAARRHEIVPAALPSDELARSDARRALQTGDLGQINTLGVHNSSRTILDALLFVLDRTSQRTGRPYIVNASWVLDRPMDLMPTVYDPPRGLIVAAAGNEDEDVRSKRRDLARWSLNGRYVLTVVNQDSEFRRTCNSSYFPESSEAVELSRAVGYRGGRSPRGAFKCGTSFSAPRVAYVVALGLAQVEPVRTDGWASAWDGWIDDVWKRIRGASAAVGKGAEDYTHPFDIAAYLASHP
jgi:hypothetical protein